MRELGLLKALLSGRGALLELFFAAVLLALGVNLLASGLAALSYITSGKLILSSSVLIVISFSLIARKLLERRYVQRKFSGLFMYNRQKNELVCIPAYEFSEAISGYFTNLFTENEAMRKLWDKEPFSTIMDFNEDFNQLRIQNVASQALIREATEYFLLFTLSAHLKDYFDQLTLDEKLLKEFGREDVPTVLFKNRFLDMFSRPMSDRSAFVDSALSGKAKPLVMMIRQGPNWVRYESFDLVLPREAQVSRVTEGKIEIDTPKLTLHLEARFDGMNINLPRGFRRLYLDEPGTEDDIHSYQVKIEVSVVFKALALLHHSGWDYYMWLDSFLDALEQKFSSSVFFKRIDWDNVMAIARVMRQASVLGSQKETDTREEVPEVTTEDSVQKAERTT